MKKILILVTREVGRPVKNPSIAIRGMLDEFNALMSVIAKETGTAQQDGEEQQQAAGKTESPVIRAIRHHWMCLTAAKRNRKSSLLLIVATVTSHLQLWHDARETRAAELWGAVRDEGWERWVAGGEIAITDSEDDGAWVGPSG